MDGWMDEWVGVNMWFKSPLEQLKNVFKVCSLF
jgi:hypothetical protein